MKDQRANLHDALHQRAFSHAVLCTFSFDPQFFEGYCLERLRALEENNNISVILDQRVHDKILSAPPVDWPRLANIRYLLHPVRVPGAFHPKVFLLASKDHGLLIIGSANFSKAGLTSNAELVQVFQFERKKRERELYIFQSAMRFIQAVAERWPSADLDSNLRELLGEADWLSVEGGPSSGPLRLIHSLSRPIWDQLVEDLDGHVDSLHVLSRFFDATPSPLSRVCATVAPKRIVLWTQNGRTTMTPAWFEHELVRNGIATIRSVHISDDNHPQPLHAKAIVIRQGARSRLAFGSANFTTSGLLSAASNANVEVMLVLDDFRATEEDVARLFDPCECARGLTKGELVTESREPLPPSAPFGDVEVHEAVLLQDRHLECRCTFHKTPMASEAMIGVLAAVDGGARRIQLIRSTHGLTAVLDENDASRCADATTVFYVEYGTQCSNRVLLTNLRDMASGRSQRRERRVREAQRSAAQFAAMLEELLATDDSEALKSFLTYCNIHMVEESRPFVPRMARPQILPVDHWRSLGVRNLHEYATLHEAALGFCERHLFRMKRHCRRASLAGIPNFMHMALSIARVMDAQVERLLVGLESVEHPLTVNEWHGHRGRLDAYLEIFRKTVELTHAQYVISLARRFPESAIAGALRSDLEPARVLSERFLQVRSRVKACIAKNLRVRVSGLQNVEPPLFPHDLLGAGWVNWSDVVQSGLNATNRWLAMSA